MKLRLLSLLVGTLITLDVATRVHVTRSYFERLGGVEWVKADWETESQATLVSWAASRTVLNPTGYSAPKVLEYR